MAFCFLATKKYKNAKNGELNGKTSKPKPQIILNAIKKNHGRMGKMISMKFLKDSDLEVKEEFFRSRLQLSAPPVKYSL